MPHPIDVLLDPISILIFGLYFGLMAWESLAPGRQLPRVPGARVRGLVGFVVFIFASTYLPYLWDATLSEYQLLSLAALPVPAQAAIGLLSYELVGYFYHRLLHSSDFLFRWIHQMHHSTERLDVPSAFLFHPFDMIGWSFVTSLGLVLVCGLSPEATLGTVIFITFLSMFQHANLKTPRALGYLIQRPESHTLHHGRGIHAGNYADLPLIDLLFGTFKNPEEFPCQTGFYDGASVRVADMLVGRDVTSHEPSRLIRGKWYPRLP